MTQATADAPCTRALKPTRRAAFTALVLTLPLLGAAAHPWVLPVILALDVLLLVLFAMEAAWLWRRAWLTTLRKAVPRLSLGEPHPVHVVFENRGAAALRVDLWDTPPNTFETTSPPRAQGVLLAGHTRQTLTYSVRPSARGDHPFGPITAEAQGPLGLACLSQTTDDLAPVRVFPSLRGLRRLELAARLAEETRGLHRIRREGAGDDFEKLRDYLPDDDFRHIDWKATARRQRPVTRVHQAERNQSVLLCIETGRTMGARAGTLTKLDHAIHAALMLAFAAVRMGDQVGLVLFSDTLEAVLPPRPGHEQFRRILRALYAAQSGGRFVDYRIALRAVRTASRRRALLVFFTDALDENELAPLLADARGLARHHLPLLLALTDPDLHTLAQRVPETVADVFTQAVAHERLHERALGLRAFRAAGGLAQDVAADAAGALAVNRYLELKRRRRL